MANQDTFVGTAHAVYGEIVLKDCYMMQHWSNDYLDNIIDIGANVGMFSLYAHMRNPKANIYAYEPGKEVLEYLKSNTFFIRNIKYIEQALGDGGVLNFFDTGYFGCNLCYKDEELDDREGTYEVVSKSLPDIFKDNSIDLNSKYFIKVDCEGGERFLLNHKGSEDIIRGASGFAVEVHFPPGEGGRQASQERFRAFPKWGTYNEWMYSFQDTHNVIYHCSSRRYGNGVYVLLKK
jgi:FkbM family methyltransferase